MIRRLALALLMSAAGCRHIPDNYPGPPDVTLGTGAGSFTPVSDGDAIPIIMGVQGGHHIWGAVRARYLDPQSLHLHFVVTLAATGTVEALYDDHQDLQGTDDGLGYGEFSGAVVLFSNYQEAQGMPCLWRLDVTDMEGRGASLEKMIVPM